MTVQAKSLTDWAKGLDRDARVATGASLERIVENLRDGRALANAASVEPTINARISARLANLAGLKAAATQARLPTRRFYKMWTDAIEKDGVLPVELARTSRLETLDIFGFAILTAPTIEAALAAATKYFPLINSGGRWTLENGRRITRVEWHPSTDDGVGERASIISVLSHFVAGSHEIGDGQALRRVEIAFGAEDRRREGAFRNLCRTHVEYRGRAKALDFSRASLARSNRFASDAMHRHFRDQCEKAVLALARDEKRELAEVKRTILALLPSANADASSVSKALAMSRRTLHRRLADHGTSFRAQLAVVRKTRAVELLESRSSLCEIAFDLGFSDASAFSRAFRQWFGEPPRTMRARLGSQ